VLVSKRSLIFCSKEEHAPGMEIAGIPFACAFRGYYDFWTSFNLKMHACGLLSGVARYCSFCLKHYGRISGNAQQSTCQAARLPPK